MKKTQTGFVEITQRREYCMKENINKRQVDTPIDQLTPETIIKREWPRKTLAQFSETEGRIEIDQVLDEYLKARDWTYSYKGVIFHSIQEAADALGISYNTLMKHLKKTDYDLEKAMESFEKEPTIAVLDGKEYKSIEDIANSLGVSVATFEHYFTRKGSIEAAYEAMKNTKDIKIIKPKVYNWNGEVYYSLQYLAKAMGVDHETLRLHTKLCNDNVEKAHMMIESKGRSKTIRTEDGTKRNITDLATILGVKQMTLKSYLDRGMTIAQIKEHVSGQDSNTPLRGLNETQQSGGGKADLLKYCEKNNLNFNCIYYMITEYGRSISEAIKYYRKNEKEIPSAWIHERYDIPLKQMLSDEGIDYQRIMTIIEQNPMPIREALEYIVVRDDAIRRSFDKEWQHEIYSAYTEPGLSEKEREECVKAFYITPEEIQAIQECKEIVDRFDRQLDLYAIEGCIQDQVFPDIEVDQMINEYFRERYERNNRTYQYEGIYYSSISEAAKALKVNYDDLCKCLRETNNDLEKAIDLLERDICYIPKIVYVYKDKVYPSIDELAKATNVSKRQLTKMFEKLPATEGRIKVDRVLDEYFIKSNKRRARYDRNRTYECNGRVYNSVKEAAEALGVKAQKLYQCLLKTDYDLEKAMELYGESHTVPDVCVKLQDGAEKTDKQSKNNTELKSFVADTIDRYAKLMNHGQTDVKEEMESSKLGEENPDL